ncbi:hypothetical protein BUALT_Bualt18G0013400 [Buddleja alternifolia]|uniref:Uncharacterized protein n=1 Tax=Buddleja alternifolia TaxID=168488 RepID=A0AAV6W3T9_9LAMI|nr:hypothetical protein BUALT_Bualt18G0013400 [Buddleja alternifolia]
MKEIGLMVGDAYAGEWCNGQSLGVGMQTCADGSCYIGEFQVWGMEIGTQGSTLEIKSMVSESITLPMVTFTKGHGMKGVSKAMACILFDTLKLNVVNGIMAILKLHFPSNGFCYSSSSGC